MAEKVDPKELVTLEEMAVRTMWEIAALVEVLERRGLLTRQEIYDAIKELRQRHPEAPTHEPPPRRTPR